MRASAASGGGGGSGARRPKLSSPGADGSEQKRVMPRPEARLWKAERVRRADERRAAAPERVPPSCQPGSAAAEARLMLVVKRELKDWLAVLARASPRTPASCPRHKHKHTPALRSPRRPPARVPAPCVGLSRCRLLLLLLPRLRRAQPGEAFLCCVETLVCLRRAVHDRMQSVWRREKS